MFDEEINLYMSGLINTTDLDHTERTRLFRGMMQKLLGKTNDQITEKLLYGVYQDTLKELGHEQKIN